MLRYGRVIISTHSAAGVPPNVPERVNQTVSSRRNDANYLFHTYTNARYQRLHCNSQRQRWAHRILSFEPSRAGFASPILRCARLERVCEEWFALRARRNCGLQTTQGANGALTGPSSLYNNQTMQVDYGDEPDSDHSLHLTANYEHAGNSGNPAFSPFRHPSAGVPAIDPGLEQSTGASRNGHAPMSVISHTAPNHLLQPDNALSSAHLGHGFYGDMARSSQPPSTPSNASPRFSAVSPNSQSKHAAPSYSPDDRSLPSQDVSDETIDDAFASFVLYCNPSFALSTDTSELVKLFRTPPKSDGNAFSTWALFELIGKFSTGEIKTWTQLALDLGVSPPDTDKGQSTQKVQQYSVRLKVRSLPPSLVIPYISSSACLLLQVC